jgi:glycosyltransferase involved in cell wall biosynthesis
MSNGKKYRMLSCHPRRQHNFEQAASLVQIFPGRFRHLTSMYFSQKLIARVRKFSGRLGGILSKRSYPKLPAEFVRSFPGTEIKKLTFDLLRRKYNYFLLNEVFQKDVLKKYPAPDICISPDTASYLIFREWKGKSFLILDLTIGVPQYRLKIQYGDRFNPQMLQPEDVYYKALFEHYSDEINLADMILCGSEFVKHTVEWLDPSATSKCRVVPYGVEIEQFRYEGRSFEEKDALKFAYVGTICHRKGADLLMEAWRDFVAVHPTCELHFFGKMDGHIQFPEIPPNVHFHGWMARPLLIGKLKQMDIFVFPTTFEGSATAIYQAMALQLPVITTANSGTVLQHGRSCEMVEVGNKGSLLAAMEKISADPVYREKLAYEAYMLSHQYSWTDYRIRLEKVLEEEGLLKK